MHQEIHRKAEEALVIMLNRGLATRDELGKIQLTAEGRDVLIGHGLNLEDPLTYEAALLHATGLLPAPPAT